MPLLQHILHLEIEKLECMKERRAPMHMHLTENLKIERVPLSLPFLSFNEADITEAKRPAFYAGSRYGRSQYGGLGASNNLRVAPRRDFHFLRYGKRADGPSDVTPKSTIQCYENVRDYILTCSFTGVQDYYRCWKG